MARLFADENFPLPVVQSLRQLGHDVLTIQESGKDNQSFLDESVLELASADDRSVLTINRKDFIALHKASSVHKGIIVCTADLDFVGQAHRIHRAINSYKALARELIRVNRTA